MICAYVGHAYIICRVVSSKVPAPLQGCIGFGPASTRFAALDTLTTPASNLALDPRTCTLGYPPYKKPWYTSTRIAAISNLESLTNRFRLPRGLVRKQHWRRKLAWPSGSQKPSSCFICRLLKHTIGSSNAVPFSEVTNPGERWRPCTDSTSTRELQDHCSRQVVSPPFQCWISGVRSNEQM